MIDIGRCMHLATARATMRAGAPDAAARARRILDLDQAAVDATVALRLCEAGFRVRPERFGLIEGTAHDAAERLKMIAGQQRGVISQCLGWETEARLRLVSALQLLAATGAVEGRAGTAALAVEAATLVRLLATEPTTSGPLRRLGREYMAFNVLAGNLQGQVSTPEAGTTLDQITARIRDLTGQVQAATSDLPYPFAHARGAITVAEFARSNEPADNEIMRTLRNAQVQLQRLPALYERALGRLVWIAEQVEATALDEAADAAPDEGSAPMPG